MASVEIQLAPNKIGVDARLTWVCHSIVIQGDDPSMASQAIDPAIGIRIRRLRQRLGLSLRHVSGQLGVTHQQVMKYEHGKSHINGETLAALATTLKTSVEVLIGKANDNETSLDDDAARLLNGFLKIKSPKLRAYVISIVENCPKVAE
jgi:transcriptional regulator with XRE-family HTH domain